MMAIYQDKKNKKYYVSFYLDGKQHVKRGFETKAEAVKYEMRAKYEDEHPLSISFNQLVNEYREYTKESISYGTYCRTGVFFEKYILPNFKNKKISDISELDCLQFWKFLNSLDKSTGYKNDILGSFKGVLKYACDFYGLKLSPARALKRFTKTREEKMKRKEKDMQIWNYDEFKKFIDCVDRPIYKTLFSVLYFTGLRKGECLALTWEDLKDHALDINKSLTRKTDNGSAYEIKEPKNVNSIRVITLNDSLYNHLMEFKNNESQIPGFDEKWFIFGRNYPIAENTLTRAKDAAITKAGVTRIGIHDFRHSHASNLIADGINIVAVSRRLGHSDIETTLRVYAHLLERNDAALVANVESNSKHIIDEL